MSYIPHEKVTLYYYDVKTNGLIKSYTFCNPRLSETEIKKIKNATLIHKMFGTRIDKMKDDQIFLQSKLIKRLAYLQKKITHHKEKTSFINAFSSIASNLKKQSRIILFTNEHFTVHDRPIDLKYANIFIYQKKFPSKDIIQKNRDYFAKNKGYLTHIYTRPTDSKPISKLRYYEVFFNTIINNQKMKSKVFVLIDNHGNIQNGWFSIYGMFLAPIRGTAQVSGNMIIKLKSKVPAKYTYKRNTAFKNDHLDIKKNINGYSGKYYNYAYSFDQDTFQYFEYKVK